MKRTLIFFGLLLALGLFGARAFADNDSFAQNTSMDVGQGAELCEKFAKKSLGKQNDFIVWVQGFFSAFNALDPKTKNITGDKDYHYVRKWLDDYCQANPKTYFGEAVRRLIEELYPHRIPNTPVAPIHDPEAATILNK